MYTGHYHSQEEGIEIKGILNDTNWHKNLRFADTLTWPQIKQGAFCFKPITPWLTHKCRCVNHSTTRSDELDEYIGMTRPRDLGSKLVKNLKVMVVDVYCGSGNWDKNNIISIKLAWPWIERETFWFRLDSKLCTRSRRGNHSATRSDELDAREKYTMMRAGCD